MNRVYLIFYTRVYIYYINFYFLAILSIVSFYLLIALLTNPYFNIVVNSLVVILVFSL